MSLSELFDKVFLQPLSSRENPQERTRDEIELEREKLRALARSEMMRDAISDAISNPEGSGAIAG